MSLRTRTPCPGMQRDGRCCPGAWLCRYCKRWHYLKRRPVRRGTVKNLREALEDLLGYKLQKQHAPPRQRVIWVILYPCLEHPARGSRGHWVSSYPRFSDSYLRGTEAGTRAALSAGMSKSRRPRRVADRAATTDIVSQLECALRRPEATLIGAFVGGLVPWFARTLAHVEIPATWSAGSHSIALVMIVVVLGCACFSGLSVYKFGRATFGDARKAIGFTLALEGVMLVSHGATSTVALLVLILINALGNGSAIALARDATCRRREADARRAATRSRSRSSRTSAPAAGTRGAVPQARQPQPAGTPGLVKVPRWSPVDDAIDAEIVSEELYS